MADPKNSILPTIAAGLPVIGNVISALSARREQKKQTERDLKFWHMQNDYNSPQNQMKRLQSAGLNPNLVYGQSSGGAAGQAERLKSPDLDSTAHKWIDPEGSVDTLSGYADFEVKKAQTDNIKANTQVAQENALLLGMKTYGEGLSNHMKLSQSRVSDSMADTSLEMAKENLRNLKQNIGINEKVESRNAVEFAERIMTQRLGRDLTSAQIANVRADNDLKKLDARLAQMGVRPNDPFYATAIMRLMTEKGWIDIAKKYSKKAGDPYGILKK